MPDDLTNLNKTKPASESFVTRPVEKPFISSAQGPVFKQNNSDGILGFYRSNKVYFWAIFAGAVIISVLAYFAFRKTPIQPVAEANVDISVEVPQSIPSGGEAVYKITVQNNDSQKLVGMQLELNYPEGMVYQSSSPNAENFSGTIFGVPDLISGQNAAIFIKTKVAGNLNESKTLGIKLRYKYANFSSEFIKQTSTNLTLVASELTLELEGPGSTNNAQLVIYTIKYQNSSDEEIKSGRIRMAYPEGFVFASANPPPSIGQDTWDIGLLTIEASGTIQIQGNFSQTTVGQNKTATAEFLILGPTGQFVVQNSDTFTTEISSLPLLVEQSLSTENSNGIVEPGDNLTFGLRYQNNSTVLAHGVNVVVTLDSKAVDLGSIRAEGGQVSNNTITWNASNVSQLETLAPNESGSLTFSLKLNDPATKDSSKNLTFTSNIKIKASEYEAFFPGNPLSFKISSPAALTTTLSFVSGQLPPKVGLSTTYKVRFALSNSSNDFGNSTLTAFIPAGGFVSSSVTGGEKVEFDANTGKLTWNVGSLPAYAGRFAATRAVEFQIVLNPSSPQVNTSPVLVKDISFNAKDLFTLQDISVSSEDINTGDLSGNEGYSKGVVQP